MKLNHPKLKEYTYLKTLGEGGQGKVIEVQERLGRRIYALKLLSSLQGERIQKEIRALQQLNHKNIVQIYDADFGDEGAYILMQHMKHGNIQEYIQKHTLGVEEKLLLIQDAADALEYVHKEKFIHRDIKPYNIFVNDDGQGAYACLGDFGVVKELEVTTITRTGAGIGTMLYFPPEVLCGEQQTQQSDIYALGMSMYEILAGKHAYDTSNVIVFTQELMQKQIEKPSRYDSLVSKELDDICMRAIAKNKEGRFESVSEFRKELKKCIALHTSEKEKQEGSGKKVIESTEVKKNVSLVKTETEKIENQSFTQNLVQKYAGWYFKGKKEKELEQQRRKEEEEQKAIKEIEKQLGQEFYEKGNVYRDNKDYEKAKEYYEDAVEKGNGEALYELGVLYGNGLGCEQDYEKAKECYEQAARVEKSPEALFELAVLYEKGYGVAKNSAKARKYYEKAIDQDSMEHFDHIHTEASYKLGTFYEHGKGVKQDDVKAREYYKKAAEKGNTNAVNKLNEDNMLSAKGLFYKANMYHYGYEGVEQDYVKSRKYYERALEQSTKSAFGDSLHDDYVEILYRLGTIYYYGYGTEQDNVKAKRYFKKAADRGNLGALDMLNENVFLSARQLYKKGKNYYHGHGDFEQNYIMAKECFEEAIGKDKYKGTDYKEALLRLGNLYSSGDAGEHNETKANEYFEEWGKEGDVKTLCTLGFWYENGDGVKQDSARAQKYFKQAVEKGGVDVLYEIGNAYRNGDGVKKDFVKARRCYEEAAEHGHEQALRNLTFFDERGLGEQGIRKGKEHYERAAERGSAEAQYQLGKLYHDGSEVVKKDEKKAIEYYEQATKKKHDKALYELGKLYYEGSEVVKKDEKKGIEYYKQAAEKGNVNAQHELGEHYEWVDQSKAVKYYRKAAEKGDADAQYALGEHYRRAYDQSKALKYYREAAKQGHVEGLFRLGYLYEGGYCGVEQSYGQAKEYFRKAAEAGNAGALYELGKLYVKGYGGRKDYAKAKECYEQALEKGNADALSGLGNLYKYGRGVERDYVKAIQYFEQAALKRNIRAAEDLIDLHEAGYGEKDDTKAKSYYELARQYDQSSESSDRYYELANLYSSRGLVGRFFFNLKKYF